MAYCETCIYSVYEKVLKASYIVWFLRNIAYRSNWLIIDTDKKSLFSNTPSSILLAYCGHGISNMAFMPQIFHPLINYFVTVFTSCG